MTPPSLERRPKYAESHAFPSDLIFYLHCGFYWKLW
jgi:hypothetical protein